MNENISKGIYFICQNGFQQQIQNSDEYFGVISPGMQTAHAANHSETPLLILAKESAQMQQKSQTDHANSQQKLFQN